MMFGSHESNGVSNNNDSAVILSLTHLVKCAQSKKSSLSSLPQKDNKNFEENDSCIEGSQQYLKERGALEHQKSHFSQSQTPMILPDSDNFIEAKPGSLLGDSHNSS